MKIESINVTAMKNVLTASFGPEATEVIEKLYGLTNEAMHEGYVAGYAEADMAGYKRGYQAGFNATLEAEIEEWEAGYDAGYEDAKAEYGISTTEPSPGTMFVSSGDGISFSDYIAGLTAALQPPLQGNCAALDAEYKRLDDDFYAALAASDDYYTSEPTFDAYSRPKAQALNTEDEDYLPFPSQERFRPN